MAVRNSAMGRTKIYRTFSGDLGLGVHESLGMSNCHYPTVRVASSSGDPGPNAGGLCAKEVNRLDLPIHSGAQCARADRLRHVPGMTVTQPPKTGPRKM